ncbi:hypothetical protein GLOIN_2v1880882 [Rhizophagus clarus]|uniref:BAH domain-containing protein n=1 Tax=Rhizophagus clarus TaxID=94130 RepID=A0A8H3LWK3_9GLOM|nr:hypothetical protein GLOIN_2v1880882 [Rhizophagus clarus]
MKRSSRTTYTHISANYIQLKSSSEQQMHDHEVLINEDVNNLADSDDDNIFSANGNIPADNYEPEESGIEERSVLDDNKSEDSGIYDNLDEVLEEFSLDFEGFDGEYATSAYEDLAKILKHPKYQKKDVTTNICQIQKWRDRLPLAKVRKYDVPLSMHKTPSTYASTKKAFTISPLTHLKQFWHSEFWQDSLLFGEDKIKSKNEEYYRAGDFLLYHGQSSTFICQIRGIVIDELDNNTLKLKVDTLLLHENLSNCRFNDNWHTFWLCDMPEPDEYDYYIKEIVYYFDGHWKYCEIVTRYKLPCKYITLSQSQQDLPTLKIFLDIYIDDFGTYRNMYHFKGFLFTIWQYAIKSS